MIALLAWGSLALALLPAGLVLMNLLSYRHAPPARPVGQPISVLIPARNEEARIGATLEAVLSST